MAIQAGGVIANLDLNTGKFDAKIVQAQSKIDKFGNNMRSVGDKMKATGKTLTKRVTTPILGVATASLKVATDFESGMSEVQALSGASGKDLAMLEAKAREMGASTKYSATEAAEGLKYMALAGWDADQSAAALEPTLKLAGATGMELGRATDIVTDTMGLFGMEAEEATRMTDVLAHAQANSNTDVEGLGNALVYAGASANAMGYDIESTSAMLGLLADQGLKGSKAGTSLNAVFTDMKDKSEDGAIAIGKTNVAIVDSEGNYRSMADIIADVEKATDGMTAAQKDQALSSVFGTQSMQAMNMMLQAGSGELKDFETELRNSEGAAGDMYDTMQDNLLGAAAEMKSALEEIALSIGERLVPYIRQGAEWVTKMADKFNALDDSTKDTIIKIGLVAAAIGPLLLVGGTLAGWITKIIVLGGKLHAGFGLISGSISAAGGVTAAFGGIVGKAVALMNPWTLGIAAVVAGGVALYKHLKKDAIPEVDRFGDSVSENTQQAVGGFMDLTEEANVHLKELAWGHQTVTAEMAKDMKKKQEEITDTLITAIDERHQQEREETERHFAELEVLDDDTKKKILEKQDKHYENQKDHTQKSHDQIVEIQNRAAERGTKITKDEAEQIEKLREGMTKTAVRTMSDSEVEQEIILQRMKENSSTITAKEAAEVVKNSNKKKKETIKDANEQHDETVNWAYRQWKEHGAMSEDEYKDVVKASEKQRDETITNAETKHKGVVVEAKKQAKEHINEVDWETGETLSKYEAWKKGTLEKAKEVKEGFVGYVKEKAKDTGKRVKEWAKEQATDYKNWKEDTNKKGRENTKEFIESTKDKVKQTGTSVRNWAKDRATDYKNWKEDTSKKARDTKDKVIEHVSTQVSNTARDTRDWATDQATRFRDWRDDTVSKAKGMAGGVVNWFQDMKEKANQRAFDMIDYVIGMPGRMATGVRNQAHKLSNAFKSMWNRVTSAISGPVNVVIDGANWVLDKLGASKIIGSWTPKQYAKGTDGHMGGPALVNDQKGPVYREAVQLPDGQTFVPEGRNVLFPNMPKGTAVLPARETKKLNMYKGGVGRVVDFGKNLWQGAKKIGTKALDSLGSVWDFISKPGKLVDKMLDKIISYKGMSGIALRMGKGVVNKSKNALISWVKKKFDENVNPADVSTGGDFGAISGARGGIGFPGFRKTSPFGWRTHPIYGRGRMHTGVDLAAPMGTNVFAQHGGRVNYAGRMGSYGNLVRIQQGAREQLYAHLSRILTRVGQSVSQGQLIGKVGSTGASTGPHLHYEQRVNGRPVHPGYARGTRSAAAGFAIVGEQGRELVNFKGGERVYSNRETEDLLSVDEIKLANAIIAGLVDNGMTKPANLIMDGRKVGEGIVNIVDTGLKDKSREDNLGRGILT